METVRFHRAVLDLLQGKDGDFSEILYRIQEISGRIGRREEDRKLGEALRHSSERLARRLMELGLIRQMPRKIRLRKLHGGDQGPLSVGGERIGWEMEAPVPGRRYCLHQDGGRVLRTGIVEACGAGYVRTQNSLYAHEVVGQKPADRETAEPCQKRQAEH
jgi:hypothetical protein